MNFFFLRCVWCLLSVEESILSAEEFHMIVILEPHHTADSTIILIVLIVRTSYDILRLFNVIVRSAEWAIYHTFSPGVGIVL